MACGPSISRAMDVYFVSSTLFLYGNSSSSFLQSFKIIADGNFGPFYRQENFF